MTAPIRIGRRAASAMQSNSRPHADDYSPLIRVGGAALLAAFVIHIVANFFLKEFPPADPTIAELETYLAAAASGLCSGVFVGAVMTTGGLPDIAFEVAAVSSLAWFLSVGIWMLWRGGS